MKTTKHAYFTLMTFLGALILAGWALGAGCSKSNENGNGNGNDQDAAAKDSGPVEKDTGDPCKSSAECTTQSDTCVQGYCSHPCASFAECSQKGLTCGLTDKNELYCLPDLSDPAIGTECAISTCPSGFDCFSKGTGDPNAFCTKACAVDRDCPPQMTCRTYDGKKSCFPRVWCGACSIDDQCTGGYNKCLTSDQGEKFCSAKCDPDVVRSCPPNSTCTDLGNGDLYCLPASGSCTGDGSYCSSCFSNTDCTSQGSRCYYSIRVQTNFCTKPCDDTNTCPAEHECFYIDDANPAAGTECRPRSDDCAVPSGGKVIGDQCSAFWDCKTGECLGWASHDYDGIATGSTHCTQVCDNANAVGCGNYYFECVSISDPNGQPVIDVCLPPEGWDGARWKECTAQCPDGPENCDWNNTHHHYCDLPGTGDGGAGDGGAGDGG